MQRWVSLPHLAGRTSVKKYKIDKEVCQERSEGGRTGKKSFPPTGRGGGSDFCEGLGVSMGLGIVKS